MDNYFEKAFQNAPIDAKEDFYKTIIMTSDSEYAKEVRRAYYKKVLKHMGENVSIGKNVKIVNPQYVSIGNNVEIMDDVTIIARGKGGITISDNVMICERVYLDTQTEEWGYINIGEGSYLGTGTMLFGHVGLEIGSNVLLAQSINLTPYSHIFDDEEKLIKVQGGHMQKVVIGNDVYVGMGTKIMYSGSIGKGSIIGCGSVVNKEIPPYSVAVGTPAKVIKKRGK